MESVLVEDMPGLRLILVFDGADLAEERPWTTDPRVTILRSETSLGPAAAMNRAIAATDSRYIARLDSDDRNLPGRLARQVAELEARPDAVAVSSRTYRIDGEGRRDGTVKLPHGDDIRRHLLLSNVVPHSTLTARRESILRAGGYDEEFRQMEDYDLILRLASLGPIPQLEDPLVEYRVHSGQTSRGAAPRGPHIAAIRRGRSALARVLGVTPASAALRHAAWRLAQHLRWHGVIRPGHER